MSGALDNGEVAVQETNAQDDADFLAGFNQARDGEPVHVETPTDKPVEDEQADPAPEAAQEQQQEPEPEPESDPDDEPVTLTRKDLAYLQSIAATLPGLRDEVRKQADSFNGRVGNLKQMIDSVKAQAAQGLAPKQATLKRLREEYPDIAEILESDLNEVLTPAQQAAVDAAVAKEEKQEQAQQPSGEAPGGTQPIDPLSDPVVAQYVQQQRQQLEMKVVDVAHPDWREISKSPEFSEWTSSLPANLQQELANTWDSSELVSAFTAFKDWRGKKAALQAKSKEKANRLANAIPATQGAATGGAVLDEQAEFEAAFKKARAR
jgi:hypothetical protein